MGRKKETPQQRLEYNVRELEESYRRWEDLSLHGGNDPFWPDGVNLNLVRNHTMYYKTKIKECCDELNIPCPEIYFRDPPPEMDPNYYAKRKEITDRAQQIVDRIKGDYPLEQYPADSHFCRNFRQFPSETVGMTFLNSWHRKPAQMTTAMRKTGRLGSWGCSPRKRRRRQYGKQPLIPPGGRKK